jgi:hypothetical protein
MALTRGPHGQRRVHVDVMTGEIEADQALENDTPSGKGGCQKYQQTGSGATISYHIQHGTKRGGLVIPSSCDPVCGIEKARNTV